MFWYGNLKERGNFEDVDVDGVNININTSLKEIGWGTFPGYMSV
jgi:hypothetical protein